ncbi:MAG: hypothetical protein WC365_10230, partial [Candidatus Babeliales bacterium]
SRINLTGASTYVAITKGSTIGGGSWDLNAVLADLKCDSIYVDHIKKVNGDPWADISGIASYPISFVVRINGSDYEVVDGSNTVVYTSADQSQAVTYAAANGKHVYIKAGITWTTASTPAGVWIQGEDAATNIIQTATPDATTLQIGSMGTLQNVSILDAFGYGTGDHRTIPNQARPVGFHVNMRNMATGSCNWDREFIMLNIGEAGVDRPGIGVIQCGIGDGFYAQTYANGAAYNCDVSDIDAAGGIGYRCYHYGSGYAFFGLLKEECTGKGLYIENHSNTSTVKAIDINCINDTVEDFSITHAAKTQGSMIQLVQTVSTYAGDALIMEMAETTGSFTGNFIKCQVDDADKFVVDKDGKIVIGGDTVLYRGAADQLHTDDSFHVGTAGYNVYIDKASAVIYFGNRLNAWDVNLYRSTTNTLKTDDDFHANSVYAGYLESTGDAKVTGTLNISAECNLYNSSGTLKTDDDLSVQSLKIGATTVISSAGVLSNVTAAAGIITSGTFGDSRLDLSALTQNLVINGATKYISVPDGYISTPKLTTTRVEHASNSNVGIDLANGIIVFNGSVKFVNNAAGPYTNLFTYIQVIAPDGTTVYIPAYTAGA